MEENIDIIGGGIGGLSVALILQRNGFKVTVFESAIDIKPVGAGIILANNAMQVFRKYNLQDKLENAGNKISFMKITDPQLKPLSIVNLSPYEKKHHVSNVAIHRSELQKILTEEVGLKNILLSKRLSIIKKNENYELEFDDHSKRNSHMIIGADGIHSVVRDQLFPKGIIRKAGQICWRGICKFDLPQKYHHELNEAWGKGRRFGFVKISPVDVYWYALINDTEENRNTDINTLFINFHPGVSDIIHATPKEKIIFNDIIDMKPISHWQEGNVCLIGDAAHAMTPNMGQGACQAIEDAYILGKYLRSETNIKEALRLYEKKRIKKAQALVNTSWSIGKMAHIENSGAVWLRNTIMRVLPDSISERQMRWIFEID